MSGETPMVASTDWTNPSVADVRTAWERYRDECFVRSGSDPVWMWSAAHDFDFARAALHLLDAPEARVDLGSVALALTAFDCHYVIPIVRLTTASLEHLQPKALFNLAHRQRELRAQQLAQEQLLDRLVHARYDVKLPARFLDATSRH